MRFILWIMFLAFSIICAGETFISFTDESGDILETDTEITFNVASSNIQKADPEKVKKWGGRRQVISFVDEQDAMIDDSLFSAKVTEQVQSEELNSEPEEHMDVVKPNEPKDYYEAAPKPVVQQTPKKENPRVEQPTHAAPRVTKKKSSDVQVAETKNVRMDGPYSNWRIPTGKGTRVTSKYGFRPRFGRMHKGVDLKTYVGEPIYAAADGIVTKDAYEYRGYGNYVIVKHSNGFETRYAHLSKRIAKKGDKVKAGDRIGLAGNTGLSTGPHLHFEIRHNGNALDPAWILNFEKGGVQPNAPYWD